MILLDYGSLWTKHFEVMELNKIMRQKDDLKFVATLNNIRTNTQTDEDSCTDMLLVNITFAPKQILSSESKPPSFFLREMVIICPVSLSFFVSCASIVRMG
jgi:hypothetical protein